MFDRRSGEVRHKSHDELCAAYKLDPGTPIFLSGTDSDAPIESWWSLGRARRRNIIRSLRNMGIAATTTPNYSLFIDQPRWDDLHAMMRIGIVHWEFLNEGLPAALHVNGRTETDFRRWAEYIRARPEVQILAYEFTTGTGWAGRRELHAKWLVELATAVERPLNLMVRGGIDVLSVLRPAFAQITVIETSGFMKTIKRQRAVLTENDDLVWRPSPTAVGAPLDDLLFANLSCVEGRLRRTLLCPHRARKPAAGTS
jgi:hypothetical protein